MTLKKAREPRTKVEAIMLEKAMNQTQLRQAMAENERLHPDTISDIVSGKKNKYTLRSLQLIAKALDVPITELMDDF